MGQTALVLPTVWTAPAQQPARKTWDNDSGVAGLLLLPSLLLLLLPVR